MERSGGSGEGLSDAQDGHGAAGGSVDLNHGTMEDDAMFGDLEAMRRVEQEFLDDGIDFATQNTLLRAGKAGIREVSGAAGENLFIGRLDVSVGADDGGNLAIEHAAHGDLLGSGLGVEIDEDDGGLGAERLDGEEGGGERVVEDGHEGAPLEIEDGDGGKRVFLANDETMSWDARRIIEGAKQAGFEGEEGDDFLLIPCVIAGGDDVDAGVEEIACDGGSNAISAG